MGQKKLQLRQEKMLHYMVLLQRHVFKSKSDVYCLPQRLVLANSKVMRMHENSIMKSITWNVVLTHYLAEQKFWVRQRALMSRVREYVLRKKSVDFNNIYLRTTKLSYTKYSYILGQDKPVSFMRDHMSLHSCSFSAIVSIIQLLPLSCRTYA